MMKKTFALVMLSAVGVACASGPRRAPLPTTPSRPLPAPERIYSRAEAVIALDSLVAQEVFRTASWGILVVHAASGDTIFSHNPAQLLVPASNTKIVTGAVALAALGPDYRWSTHIASTGQVRNGVLLGDLVVTGRGDPTVSSRMRGDALTPLREIADSLAARGIRRVEGRIVRGGNAFPDALWGAGWQWDYLASGYAAGVDELFFNEGTARVVVRGAPVAGSPALVTTSPARTFPVVKVLALTRQPSDSSRTRIAVEADSGGGGVTVTGYIAPGDSSVQTIVLRDPGTAFLFALREAMSEKGITVDSLISAEAVVGGSGQLYPLFTYSSAPFREVLGEMMKPSQNQVAEIFLRTVGLEKTGVGSADSGARVVRRTLLEWGVAPDGFALRDGSGLTRNNFISPESIVRVLSAMRGHELFHVFFDALPTAGADGTLRSRMSGTPAERNLRGKTGTLARASALSGYVRTLDGQEIIFSTLCNNFTAPADAVVGMQNRIGIILASLDWRR